jgi:hypothetical protein
MRVEYDYFMHHLNLKHDVFYIICILSSLISSFQTLQCSEVRVHMSFVLESQQHSMVPGTL